MSFLTAERISALATEILARTIVLPATVSRVPVADYTGSGGKTIIRVPRRRTATEVSGPLNYDSISEDPVEVTVARWYDGVQLTPDETTLAIVEFGRQVIAPMTQAIAEAGENVLAGVMNDFAPAQDFTDLTDGDKTRDDVLAMRQALTEANVPAANRTLAVAPDVASGLLRVRDFVKVNESGQDSALRNGLIGRVFGLDVVESNALTPGSGIAYHRSAFAFATLAPALPQGGASAASKTVDGIALRAVFAYDTSTGGDVILLDTYGGAVAIENEEDSGDPETNGPRAVRFASDES